MDNRLSNESVQSVLDAGHQSLPWQPGQPSGFLAGIDFELVLANPDAKKIIQSMPVQPLYHALKQKGLADCLDVLALLTQDQVTRILDFEVWQKDQLDVKKAIQFLKYFGEISQKELYKRFAFLDEEYQLAILTGFFKVYEEEEFENLPAEIQDQLYAMPCRKVFYEILSEDPEEAIFLEGLLESIRQNNLRYAYSLLGHAAFAVPNEHTYLTEQFRRARLEEEGFVSYQESLEIFSPINRQELVDRWQSLKVLTRQGAIAEQEEPEYDFLGKVLRQALIDGWDLDAQFEIHQKLLYLANALCSAAQVEPDDRYGLNRVLEQAKALVGLGLEYLAKGNVEVALEVIKVEAPKILFRVGLSLIDDLRRDTIQQLNRLEFETGRRLERQYLARHWGAMLFTIDRELRELIGFEASEMLKGLFNRFPMVGREQAEDMRVVFAPIGSMNVYQTLKFELWSFLGQLEIVRMAGVTSLKASMEQVLQNATIWELLRHKFTYQPLDRSSIDRFKSFSLEEIQHQLTVLKKSLRVQLEATKLDWAPQVPTDQIDWVVQGVVNQYEHVIGDLMRAHQYDGAMDHLLGFVESGDQK